MKKAITPGQISRTNLELIYHYIYKNGPVSQQDISYDLRLSRPTVTSKLGELETLGMIKKDGQISSDLVGRKAERPQLTRSCPTIALPSESKSRRNSLKS